MSVSGYTPQGLPLFDSGGGGWGSAWNGIAEWLDTELLKARNIVTKNGQVVVKNGEVVYKKVSGQQT